MYETTSPILQSELNYRIERLKRGKPVARRRSHVRVPWVRRPADSVDHAR